MFAQKSLIVAAKCAADRLSFYYTRYGFVVSSFFKKPVWSYVSFQPMLNSFQFAFFTTILHSKIVEMSAATYQDTVTFAKEIKFQIDVALREACAAVMVVDGNVGVTADDLKVAKCRGETGEKRVKLGTFRRPTC